MNLPHVVVALGCDLFNNHGAGMVWHENHELGPLLSVHWPTIARPD
jgi:hypothetical protein